MQADASPLVGRWIDTGTCSTIVTTWYHYSAMCSAMRVLVCCLGAAFAGKSEEVLERDSILPLRRARTARSAKLNSLRAFLELEAGALAHHVPQAMKDLRFAEPVWVIGYSTISRRTIDGTHSSRELSLPYLFRGSAGSAA